MILSGLGIGLLCFHFTPSAQGEGTSQNPATSTSGSSTVISDPHQRNFYEVLEDLMADFEYDLKNGNVGGLKDLSIRNLVMSENIPFSFRSHLELLITERVLRTSKTRVIQCLPCRAKKTALDGDQIRIVSADSDPQALAKIAKAAGIARFLDASFLYQPSGMILSLLIIDPESSSILWSQSYHSETSRSAAFRRGVDYKQIDEARRSNEYIPSVQYRAIFYYLSEPALPSRSGVLSLGYRMMERYDNRKKEVGFEANYMVSANSIINQSGASSANYYKAYGINLTALFMHSWNFIGEEENYNQMRGSFSLGLGGTYASGYLAALVRSYYEWRLGRHCSFSFVLGYRPPSTAFMGNTASGTVKGIEYGLGIHWLF